MPLHRREYLASMAAVAGGQVLFNEIAGAQENPAAQVGDRTTTIKITALKTYWVGPHVFVKIETNHGVNGWGDLKGVDPRVSKPLAEALYQFLDGENPTRIEHLWQKIFRAHRDIRGGPFL